MWPSASRSLSSVCQCVGEPSRWGMRATAGSGEPSSNKRGRALIRVGIGIDLASDGCRGDGRDGRGQASNCSWSDLRWRPSDAASADARWRRSSTVVRFSVDSNGHEVTTPRSGARSSSLFLLLASDPVQPPGRCDHVEAFFLHRGVLWLLYTKWCCPRLCSCC